MDRRERFQRAKAIFLELCDLPASGRARALDDRCGADAALRAEVLALLRADQSDAGEGEPSQGRGAELLARSMADDLGGSSDVPVRIGPYRIIGELGRGGMGVVYEAEQENPRRTIALKVLRELIAGREAARRFEREAHLLGVLQHPGIAQVHEAGAAAAELASGRTYDVAYFAMELIRGEPIDAFVRGRSLPRRAILELFARVCDAVQHAHDRGVIHRDLKPDNILVDTRGEPKVLDFGIARITDADVQTVTMRTEVGQLIGTAAYMSPEQLAGDPDEIDTRTDVYSLGVVLFRLLADRMPFELQGKPIIEVARIVQQEEPTTLSTVDRSLRGDLETIVLTAMEKDPARRYRTPSELAADVRRFLADEPLVARPASAMYQLRKFARRNKALVGGVVAGLALLVVGAAAAVIGLIAALDANTALQEANLELESSNESLVRITRFQAEQLTGFDVERMGADLRRSLLASAAADDRADLERALAPINLTNQARDSLDEHLFRRTILAIDEQFADEPAVRGSLLQAVAIAQRRLGLYESALGPQRRALELVSDAHGERSAEASTSLSHLGAVLVDAGELEQAETVFRRSIELAIEVDGPDHPETLAARNGLGSVLSKRGELEAAETTHREVLEARQRVLAPDDPAIADSLTALSVVVSDRGRFDEALALAEEAMRVRRRGQGPEAIETLWTESTLAAMYMEAGRPADSEPLYRRVLEARRRILGDEHPSTITSINNLASTIDTLGRYEDAEALYREGFETSERVHGPDHPDTLRLAGNLGYVVNLQGRRSEAEPLYRRAYEGLRRLAGEDHPATLNAMGNLASLLSQLGRRDEAEPLMLESLERRQAALGADHPLTLNAVFNYGEMLRKQERLDEAEPYCVASLEGYRRVAGDDHMGTLYSLVSLGELRLAQGRRAEAEPLFREALERRTRILGEDHPDTKSTAELLERARSLQDASQPAPDR